MPFQPFLIEGYDYLWALDIGFLGRDQVSLIRVHFVRNMSSPLESVSPVIHAGFKPQAKPCGFSDFFFLSFFGLLSCPFSSESESALCLPLSDFFSLVCSFL